MATRGRDGAAAGTWTFRGDGVATAPRPPWRRVATAPRLRRGNSVETGKRRRYVDSEDGRKEFVRAGSAGLRLSVFEVDGLGVPKMRRDSVVAARAEGERRRSIVVEAPPAAGRKASAAGRRDSLGQAANVRRESLKEGEGADAAPWWRRRASSVAANEYKGNQRRKSSAAPNRKSGSLGDRQDAKIYVAEVVDDMTRDDSAATTDALDPLQSVRRQGSSARTAAIT